MRYEFSFSEIPEQGMHLEINDWSWFPEEQVQRTGPVAATLFLAKKGENKVEISGRLDTEIQLACDRCLGDFVYRIDTPIHLILEVNDPGQHWRIQDIEGTEANIDTVLLDAPKVDLGEILREQVFLALPEKQLCRESCAGLCGVCGANLNEETCSCSDTMHDSPFSVLARLKKNK
jgi:uncharacterized protein